jgi:hypothetical protein
VTCGSLTIRPNEDDDSVHVEDDDSRRATDKEVDEPHACGHLYASSSISILLLYEVSTE